MFMHKSKKGFTIVELVIVIAVIAILAAVLIPTFSNLVKKANQSADIQAVRQMNEAIAESKKDITDINTLIDTLAEKGYNSQKTLVPVSANYAFYWDSVNNIIVLVDDANAAIFPEGATYTAGDEKYFSLESSIRYVDVVAKDSAALAEAIVNGNEEIKLEADVVLDSALIIPSDKNITIDLNGKKLTTETYTDGGNTKHYYIEVSGKLTLEGGEIEGRGVWAKENSEIVVKDAKISAIDPNGGAAININPGAKVVIENGEFYSTAANSMTDGASVIMNQGGELIINGGKFESTVAGPYVLNHKSGTTVVNGGDFYSLRGCVCAVSVSGTLNGGCFVVSEDGAHYPLYVSNGSIVVNGGNVKGGSKTVCVDASGSGSVTIKAGTIVEGKTLSADKTY